MVVCRLRRNKDFHSCTSQKAPEPNLAAEKHTILQNGAASAGSPSDWDSMVDFYLAGESGEELLTEMGETAENLQVCPLRFVYFFVPLLVDEYGSTIYAFI